MVDKETAAERTGDTLQGFKDLSESQCQNMALTGSYVPNSLDSGHVGDRQAKVGRRCKGRYVSGPPPMQVISLARALSLSLSLSLSLALALSLSLSLSLA